MKLFSLKYGISISGLWYNRSDWLWGHHHEGMWFQQGWKDLKERTHHDPVGLGQASWRGLVRPTKKEFGERQQQRKIGNHTKKTADSFIWILHNTI